MGDAAARDEIVGVDTGGTFTDVVGADGRVRKVLSTPDDPGHAVRAGLVALEDGAERAGRPSVLAHGTTVATNALLERAGARTALITTAGFADLIEIARQDRPSLYDPWSDRPTPLVPGEWRLEVDERIAADGSVLVALDVAAVPDIPTEVEAVAVCLLHSDLAPDHERAVVAALAERGVDVCGSFSLSPQYREYERMVTTVVNAYLRPACRRYLEGLADVADEVLVMTSAGGLTSLGEAAEAPARLLVSGPAGGVRAAATAAVANGFPDALTFDMGGTSTDVCLVLDGEPAPAAERVVDGYPVRLPSLDVHTVGAGGGSIAALDPGGALTVGPRSAGALPGPVCYGRGGTAPTVTDANLVAGHIPADAAFPDLGVLDRDGAVAALEDAGVSADGVLDVVNATMEQALRVVSVERGVDPAGLALVAFGGAGPLHGCDLAEALGITTVIVPARAGVLSAVGLIGAPRQREVVRTWPHPLDHDVEEALDGLADEARRDLVAGAGVGVEDVSDADVVVETFLDCRYAGQSHEISVASVEAFPEVHEQRNGYRLADAPIEIVALRARATRPSPGAGESMAEVDRVGGVGPRVIVEDDCTIWVPEGWQARPGAAGALVLTPVVER